MKRIIVAIIWSLIAAGSIRAETLLNGAGSTFDYPIFTRWFGAYAKIDPGVHFNYQAVGSGGGLRQIEAQTIDFGASDAPMSDRAMAEAPGKILNIPIVAGGEAIVFTLPGIAKLRLDSDALAAIFLGKITKWNDPKIAGLNPQVSLPDLDILVVHRSDGSGTTYIFTDYLSNVSSAWKSQVGKGSAVNWPVGLGGNGNEGVADQVLQNPGSIGYVELAYARNKKMSYADLKNGAGNYVLPTLESVTAALATATIPDDFRFSIVNASGDQAYPISGASWLLIYQFQKDAEKGKKLVQFAKWAMTEGQKLSPSLDYAPIPPDVAQRVLKHLDDISFGN
jgi:phosphate transport system substrate-binding protein